MKVVLDEKGASLIFIILLILVLGAVSAAMVSIVSTESFNAMNQSLSGQALHLTEAGIEKAMYQFKTGTGCGALGVTNTLGSGTFTTIGTPYNIIGSTTLAAGIVAADTTLTLSNPAGNTTYAPHGRIQIDSELIDYTSKLGTTQLTGLRRGINGTTAAIHNLGASVLQGQCLIRSTGTIAGPIPGIGAIQRVIETSTAVSSKEGSFTKSTGGAPVSQSITGVGFQAKAVIFFWTRQAASAFAPQNSFINAGVGFASGPANERSVSITARDGRNRSDNGRMRSVLYPIVFLTGGGGGGEPTVVARAGLTSFDPDGFTINWQTNDTNAYIIHYVALGGDITNAVANTFNLSTGAGNQSVAGIGFQPDFVMFLWSYTEGADTAGISNSEIGLGFAVSAAAEGALVYSGRDGNGSNADKRWQQRTNASILILDPTNNPPDQDAVADFVSMNTDGFTVNKSDAPSNSTPIFYLALKGGRHQVGAFTQPAATGNQSISGVGFRPEQLMLASFNLASTVNIVGGGAISYGAARYPNAMGNIWFQDRSDNDESDANMYTNTGDLITMAYGTAVGNTDGNPAIRAQADFASFDRDGFTLNWTTANATARQILYWVIGPTVAEGKIDWQEIY